MWVLATRSWRGAWDAYPRQSGRPRVGGGGPSGCSVPPLGTQLCLWGGEHQSRADEAVVLGTPPPPGPPLPRAPALALQHPHSAQFRASCVGSGFVRVFFPLECSKTRQRLRKTPSELTGCASTGRNTGAARQPSPPLSLQPPDCNFAGKRGCSLRAPDAGHANGIPVKFPKPPGKQAPSREAGIP